MKKKQSETSLGLLMRGLNYFVHKWRDRGYISCPRCHVLLKTCPVCHEDMLLPKAQSHPDFLIAMKWAYVECKQGGESWPIGDISDVQQSALNDHHNSWIFLEMGTGRAPKGKGAWLIPWEEFKEMQRMILAKGHKSIRFQDTERSKVPTADDAFHPYRLYWQTNEGWTIPEEHEWWQHGDPS